MKKLHTLLLLLLGCASVALAQPSFREKPEPPKREDFPQAVEKDATPVNATFSFAVLSDLHICDTIEKNTEDLRQVIADINNRSSVAFVLVSGDITHYGDAKSLQLAKKLLATLRVPYYVIPGNHDLRSSESGGVEFSRLFGDSHFRLLFNDYLFLGINSGQFLRASDGHIMPEDLAWLEYNLRKAGHKQPVFLIVHLETKVNFRVIVPQEQFNFHRFLNIGITETKGDFVALCNNDIEFQKGWYTAILSVKAQHPEFMCFSPLDRSYPMMSEKELPSSKAYYIGWTNKKHYAAWCMVWERKVFKIIGLLDETFDFYSADDDELQTLRYWAIPNVVVTGSEVKHLSQVVTQKVDQLNNPIIPQELRERYPLTDAEIKRGLAWLWDDERFYVAYQRMKAKWGNAHMRERVDRFFDRYPLLRKRLITRILYSKSVVNLLAVLTRA